MVPCRRRPTWAAPMATGEVRMALKAAGVARTGRAWPAGQLRRRRGTPAARPFSSSAARGQILDISALPERIIPNYEQTPTSSLLSLHWPRPPRNMLLMPKLHAPRVTVSAVEFARYIHGSYPDVNIVLEPHI